MFFFSVFLATPHKKTEHTFDRQQKKAKHPGRASGTHWQLEESHVLRLQVVFHWHACSAGESKLQLEL